MKDKQDNNGGGGHNNIKKIITNVSNNIPKLLSFKSKVKRNYLIKI